MLETWTLWTADNSGSTPHTGSLSSKVYLWISYKEIQLQKKKITIIIISLNIRTQRVENNPSNVNIYIGFATKDKYQLCKWFEKSEILTLKLWSFVVSNWTWMKYASSSGEVMTFDGPHCQDSVSWKVLMLNAKWETSIRLLLREVFKNN